MQAVLPYAIWIFHKKCISKRRNDTKPPNILFSQRNSCNHFWHQYSLKNSAKCWWTIIREKARQHQQTPCGEGGSFLIENTTASKISKLNSFSWSIMLLQISIKFKTRTKRAKNNLNPQQLQKFPISKPEIISDKIGYLFFTVLYVTHRIMFVLVCHIPFNINIWCSDYPLSLN